MERTVKEVLPALETNKEQVMNEKKEKKKLVILFLKHICKLVDRTSNIKDLTVKIVLLRSQIHAKL